MARATRPDLLSAGVATGTASGAQPDGELQGLADRFLVLQAQIDAIASGASNNEGLDGLVDAQVPLLDAMEDITATTLAGHRARVRVLMRWFALRTDGTGESELEWHRTWPLFRDLLGEAA